MTALVLPSMVMMILLAILYRHLRSLPDTERLFRGLNAAVVAVIAVAAWRIGRNTLTKSWQWYVIVLSAIGVVAFPATIIEIVLPSGLFGYCFNSFAPKP